MIPDYPTIIILSICGLYIYARILDDGYGYTFMLHKNVSRETSVKQLYYIILRFLYGNVEGMLLSRSPIATTDSRTRIDFYSSRAFVSSHSRKLANAQTERSVAATSTVLVTESKLGSGYLFCYVTAENWNITIRFNFIAICGIILLISIVFL